MTLVHAGDINHITDVRSVEQWLQNVRRPRYWDSSEYTHFAYLTEDKELCLAKVLQAKLKTADLSLFYLLGGSQTFNKKKHQGKVNFKIQIGDASDLVFGADSGNVRIATHTELIMLPMPISLDETTYSSKKNSDSKWIITNEKFQNARNLCFRMLYYAKRGDWNKFKAEYNQIKLPRPAKQGGSFQDYYFFSDWTILHEAVANHQDEFCIKYLAFCKSIGVSSDFFYEVAAIYGNLTVFETIPAHYQMPYDTCLHFAIKHGHHKILKWFLDGKADRGTSATKHHALMAIKSKHLGSNLLGTALMHNDLESVRILVESKRYSTLALFEVESIVWERETALQACLILCGDNFELIKYMIERHKPDFCNKKLLDALEPNDPYLVWRDEIKSRFRWNYETGKQFEEQYTVRVRDSLRGLITHKPDAEGMTVDDRIEFFGQQAMLTEAQCRELKRILHKRRERVSQ